MKVAITNGTGLVGRALQLRLEAEGHTVRALSRWSGADVADVDALAATDEGARPALHTP